MLLSILPLMASAQISTVTEAQKQQALQTVSNFCSLFQQWANGQRTLDAQIYALCSGNDCSAYDDVSTNKETTLRNYLLGIQKKYPRSLSMQISQPSLVNSSITYDLQIAVDYAWREGSESAIYGTALTANSKIMGYNNAYIVFDVVHSFPSLNKSTPKKIIYDVKAGKVTAFITGNGTFISYLQGFDLCVKKDYENAISKFAYAADNSRSAMVKRANELICSLYMMLGDVKSAGKYADLIGDQYLSAMCKSISLFTENRYSEAIVHLLKCESLINSTIHTNTISSVHFLLGNCYLLGAGDAKKATYYLRKSAEEGYPASGFLLYSLYLLEQIDEEDVSIDEAFDWLAWSAENGYPPAFFSMGQYEEFIKNISEAVTWYTKAANYGNPVGMACLGKLLIEQGGTNVAKGKDWLRRSLEGNGLETYLKDYEAGIGLPMWPKSRADVQKLLNETHSNITTSTAQSSTTAAVNTATNNNTNYTTTSSSSATTSSSNYTAPSNNRYRHHKFNQSQDGYIGGFSVGYIQKQWTIEENGEKEKCGLFDDDKYLQGIQAGFRIDPQFGAGFGMNSGLFYEYCWAKSDDMHESYGTYHQTYEEHGLYLPLHLKFTMNFSKWFQLSFYGGTGFYYALSGRGYLRDDGETYASENVFSEEEDWKKFNMMLEYGLSIRINALQIDVTQSQGLNNWSDTDGVKIKQGRPLAISATICF